MDNDSVKLLRECNAGIKMGVNSIKRVLPYVENKGLKKMLNACKDEHAVLADKAHSLLLRHGANTKDPHPVARAMSEMKIAAKMIAPTESTIADVMTDGCDMGIKSLSRYINKYKNADMDSREIANKLILIEDTLERGLRIYL